MTSRAIRESAERSPAHRWLHWSVYAAFGVVLWFSLPNFPDYTFGIAVHQSFEQALAHFLKTHAQAGKDYVFTFGPLGYFYTTAYDPDLFWNKYAWELIIKLAVALVCVAVLIRQPSAIGRF